MKVNTALVRLWGHVVPCSSQPQTKGDAWEQSHPPAVRREQGMVCDGATRALADLRRADDRRRAEAERQNDPVAESPAEDPASDCESDDFVCDGATRKPAERHHAEATTPVEALAHADLRDAKRGSMPRRPIRFVIKPKADIEKAPAATAEPRLL